VSDNFRRTDPRYARRLEVEVIAGDQRRGRHHGEYSLGGLFVETSEAFPLQTRLQVRFQIPTQPNPSRSVAKSAGSNREAPANPAAWGFVFRACARAKSGR